MDSCQLCGTVADSSASPAEGRFSRDAPSVDAVPPPPVPEAAAVRENSDRKRKRDLKTRTTDEDVRGKRVTEATLLFQRTESEAAPGDEGAQDAEDVSVAEKEREFWRFFKGLVSEWNPCFAEDGQQRVSFQWDENVGAHDIEVSWAEGVDPAAPSRARLSEVLSLIHI